MQLVGRAVAPRDDVGALRRAAADLIRPPRGRRRRRLEAAVLLEGAVDERGVAPSALPQRRTAAALAGERRRPVLLEVRGQRRAVPVQLHQTAAEVAADGRVGRVAAQCQPGPGSNQNYVNN